MVTTNRRDEVKSPDLYPSGKGKVYPLCFHYLADPYKWPYRFTILGLLCFLKITLNYIYDIPGGIQELIIEIFDVGTSQYDLLYTLYSLPNIVLAICGGIIIDQVLGLRKGIMFFLTVTTCGQLVVALGAYFNKYWLMLIGRFVIGMGAEVVFLSCDASVAVWFRHNELNLGFAFIALAGRSGGSASLLGNNPLYEALPGIQNRHIRVSVLFFVGLLACFAAYLACIVFVLMDGRGEKLMQRHTQKKKCSNFFSDLKKLRVDFWLLVVIYFIYIGCFFSFTTLGQMYFNRKFGLPIDLANTANMLVYALTISAPLIGIVITYVGFPLCWLFAGFLLVMMVHLLLSATGLYFVPFIATSLMSISYIFSITTLSQCVSLLVDDNSLGTAFGILYASSNASTALLDFVLAKIIDEVGYFIMEVVIEIILFTGVCLIIFLAIRLIGKQSQMLMSGWRSRSLRRVNVYSINDTECSHLIDNNYN
jgi:MFS family permease